MDQMRPHIRQKQRRGDRFKKTETKRIPLTIRPLMLLRLKKLKLIPAMQRTYKIKI